MANNELPVNPIEDEIENIPLPEVVPLKDEKVKKFEKMQQVIFDTLPVWANVHLKALGFHPQSPVLHFDVEKIKDEVFEKSEIDFDHDFNDMFNAESVLREAAERTRLMDPQSWRLDWSLPGDDFHEREVMNTSLFKAFKKQVGKLRHKLFGKEVEEGASHPKSSPVQEPSAEAQWLTEMIQHIQMCQVSFRILRKLGKNLTIIHQACTHGSDFRDGCYEGESANSLNDRINFIETVQVLVFILVWEIEDMLHKEDLFRECIELYKKECPKEKKGSVSRVVQRMVEKKSVLGLLVENEEKDKDKDLTKSESQQQLLINFDNPEIDLLDYKMIKPEPQTSPSTSSSGPSSERHSPRSDIPKSDQPIPRPRPKGSPVPLIGSSAPGSLDQAGDNTGPASAPGEEKMDKELPEGDDAVEGGLDKKLEETSMN